MVKEITIHTPSKMAIREQANNIEVNNTKDHIIRQIKGIQEMLENVKNIRFVDSHEKAVKGTPAEFANFFSYNLSPFKKRELAEMLAAFIAHPENKSIAKSFWSPDKMNAINLAAENGIISQKVLDKTFKTVKEGKQSRGFYGYYYGDLSDMYKDAEPLERWIEYTKRSNYGSLEYPLGELYAKLPSLAHHSHFEQLHPEISQPFPEIETLPENPHATIVNLESRLGNALNFLFLSYKSGAIEKLSNRVLSKSAMKNILKASLDFDPFEDTLEKVYSTAMHEYFIKTLAVRFVDILETKEYPISNASIPDVLKAVKVMFNNLAFVSNTQIVETILPHCESFNRTDIVKLQDRIYFQSLVEVLKTADKGWIDTKLIKRKTYSLCIQKGAGLIMSYGISSSGILSITKQRKITPSTLNEDVMYPYIEGLLASMVAIGALEAEIEPSHPEDAGYFSRMRHVRLTGLGRYLLGLTKKYKLEYKDRFSHQFDLVEGSMLIYSRIPDTPYIQWLKEIGTQVGRYWRVDTRSFLNGCMNLDDLEHRIDQFHNIISDNPGQMWTDFFNKLKKNASNGILPYEGPRMQIMSVDPNNKELHKLLASKPICDKVVRCEGYNILVPVLEYEEFRKFMVAHGYLF